METKLKFWQNHPMTDVERYNFATSVAQAVLDALRRGRAITIDVEDEPHPEAVAEGVDPPLSIDEVRRILADAADGAARGSKLFALSPETAIRLCDAIERGFVVVDDMSRPAPRPTGFREWHAGNFCPPGPTNERCSTVPVSAEDGDGDSLPLFIGIPQVPHDAYAAALRLCQRIAARRDHWKQAARKWEKAWVSAARQINRLNVAAQDRDAELALLRRGSDARPRLVDELPPIPPVDRARVEAMRRGGTDCTLRYIGAEVQRCTSRSGNAGDSRWWLAIDRDTLIALCDGWLRGKSPSLAEKDAEIRRLSDALAKSADEIMCGDAGTIRRLQATVCDLMNSCGIAEAEVKRLTGSLADARKEVLAGGRTEPVAYCKTAPAGEFSLDRSFGIPITASALPFAPQFITLWPEDPRKADPQ